MVISEIRKNGEKQEKIEELEKVIREKDRNANDNDTKIALERAKDVIVEYKSEISRVTKEKDIEVGKVKVEKIRLEEELRIATLEKKRLADSERILLNTFDTLKKYYDTKEKDAKINDENTETGNKKRFSCTNCDYVAKERNMLEKHTTEVHGPKTFRCNSCNFEDVIEDNLRKHMADIHETEADLECMKCTYKANTKTMLSKHIADIHDIDTRQNRNGGQRYISGNRRYMSQNENRTIKQSCFYWNRGYCKFGSNCFNKHEETPFCTFQERCNRKNVCKFFHADNARNFLDNRYNTESHR